MKDTLKPGQSVEFSYVVPVNKTVPDLYPDAAEFQAMPAVFATGFMVGLMEWTALKVLAEHLDEGEGSLGTHINVSHSAPTVPGQTVTVVATCAKVAGRRITFDVRAHDGIDKIGEGQIERMVVPWKRFEAMVAGKAATSGLAADLWRKD